MRTRAFLLLSICSLLVALSLSADSVDDLFDTARLHDVRITMSRDDWSRLRATYLENTNYPVTITIDGETVPDSTIRSRGSATRNGVKPGLRVDFNRTVKTQRFRGFKILVLDNMYNDPTFLHEQLAFSMLREMGVLVPRESFARMTVNGEYWGLYSIVEPIDQVFVTRHVDGGEGNLFEYNVPASDSPDRMPGWDFALSRGESISNYVPEPFEPKTNADTLDGTALLSFIRTVSHSPDETFIHDISQFVSPEALLTHYAVEVATAEVDGLTSFFGVNNFYLYQLQGTSRFLFIPWDHDFNFTSVSHSIYFGASRNRLIQRILGDPESRSFYHDTLRAVMNRYMNPAWAFPRIDAMLAQIRSSVLEDTKRRGGDNPATAEQEFDDAVANLRVVITGRGAYVEAQLRPGRLRSVRR